MFAITIFWKILDVDDGMLHFLVHERRRRSEIVIKSAVPIPWRCFS